MAEESRGASVGRSRDEDSSSPTPVPVVHCGHFQWPVTGR